MKKSRKYSTLALIVLAATVMFSCKKTSQHSTKIVFDSLVVQQRIPLLQVNDTTLPYADMQVKFTYPVKFGSPEELARLQQIFIGTFFNNIELDTLSPREAMDAFVAEYRDEYQSLSNSFYESKREMPDGEIPSWYWYNMNNSNQIVFSNDSLLCYAVEYSDYTGGAHGSYRITYTNVDLTKLVTVSEEDIFIPNYQKPLRQIIIRQLTAKYHVSVPDSIVNLGFFNIDELYPNNNFWLSDKGMHYAYNQYEIAPYSMGVIDIDIPYADLEPILRPDNVLRKFFPEKENH